MSEPQGQSQAAPSTKRKVFRTILLLLLIGGGTAGYFLYSKAQKEKKAKEKAAADAKRKPQRVLVTVAKTRRSKIARRERYMGELIASQVVEVAPKAAGRLEGMRKKMGDKVRRGQLIAWLDSDEIKKQIEEAKAAVVVAEAQVLKARAELARSVRERKRKKPLFDKQLLTRQEMDNLDSAIEVAKATITLSQAQVKQAETKVRTLRTLLKNTKVYAPLSGRINRRYTEPGAMVSTATALYQIVTAQKILAKFKVPERDLQEPLVGKEVRVHIEPYPQQKFTGKVIRVAPAVDPTTRTATAEAKMPTYGGKLRPGMFARVDVIWSKEQEVILAPQRAVIRPPNDPKAPLGVFVHDKGMARFKSVRTGREYGSDIEVRGIGVGVEVIVEGQHGLRDGAIVAVSNASKAGTKPSAPPAKAPTRPTAAAKPALPKG